MGKPCWGEQADSHWTECRVTPGLTPFLGHREFKLGGFWIRVFAHREWGLGGKQESTERGELQRWVGPVIGRRETEKEKSSSSC